MKHWKKTDAAYLAAFIDGEGTISIYRSKNDRCLAGFQYRPVIEISNTHLGVLEWIYALVGDGWLHIVNPGNVRKKGHKPLHKFRVNTSDCRWVIPQIRPYLKIKGAQADILLEYFDRVKTTRPERVEETERLTRQLNELNRRGTPTS